MAQLDFTRPENDPEGSVSIFKLRAGTSKYEPECEVGFEGFNSQEVPSGMRVGGVEFTTFAMVSTPHQFPLNIYVCGCEATYCRCCK